MSIGGVRKKYLAPLVLDHRLITFETAISSQSTGMVSPMTKVDTPSGDLHIPDTPSGSLHLPDQPGIDHSYFNGGDSSTSGSTMTSYVSDYTSTDSSTDHTTFFASKDTVEMNSVNIFPMDDSIQTRVKNNSVTDVSSQTILNTMVESASMMTNSTSSSLNTQHSMTNLYLPPNTATYWYTWGLEGLIVVSLSGILFFIKRNGSVK